MYEPQRGSIASDSGRRLDTELVLTHLDNLPTLSAVAVRVLQVTSDAATSAEDVVQALHGDQSLTAKILSVAGSAWKGVPTPMTTLERAVPLLGFSAIRSIVLSVSVFECFPARGPDAGAAVFQRGEFWKHALAVACAARRLALDRKELGIDPPDAFVAGLLHDLGKVALSALFPKGYDRIVAQVDQSRGDVADFERAILGVDHTVAGRRLAERWRLPRELQEVIWLHHLSPASLPTSVLSPGMIGTVQLADTIAREQRVGYSGNHMFYENSPGLAERLGFAQTQIDAVVHTLVSDVAEHSELLGLDRAPPDTLYVDAMARANTELGRLNTELSLSSQRLAASARYFRATSQLSQQLDAWSDPPAVVAAMTGAAATGLQRSKIGAFGLRDNQAAVDICWISDEPGRGSSLSQSLSAEVIEWLANPGECLDAVFTQAPAPVRSMLGAAIEDLGSGAAWLVPVLHDGTLIGGIVFRSESDERVRLAGERDDLRCFVATLGLALGRANAQAAARRLADDLAETNRRLQQMQVELLRSRTLSMIAEMAAGAGHELNSPLAVISGRAQMLAKTTQDPDSLRSLELIRAKAHECSALVSELMDFARPRSPHLATVDLADLLAEVRAEWLQRAGLPEARLQTELQSAGAVGDAAQPVIQADRDQLKTVFRELLANAGDALVDETGMITIACRPAVAEDFVELLVRDTGCGMPPSVLQRAFDPFFSHRRAGRGRGLGLPRVYRIVEGHGGRIWLESVPGEGTTAHILLPRRAANAPPPPSMPL